jgi:FixJ family two-component response regulator
VFRELVVVVDDDHDFRKGLERVLRSYGFDVSAFVSAENYLASGINVDDVSSFVLDINLTGISGTTLAQLLWDQSPMVRVVFITADGSVAARAAANSSDCIAFFEKPFRAKQLVDIIRLVP